MKKFRLLEAQVMEEFLDAETLEFPKHANKVEYITENTAQFSDSVYHHNIQRVIQTRDPKDVKLLQENEYEKESVATEYLQQLQHLVQIPV